MAWVEPTVAPTVIILEPMHPQTPPSPETLAPPYRRMRWLALFARVLLWLVASFWLLFGASWGLLHGWIVPRIGEFRPQLEMQASKALGMPVRIGQITAQSEGMIPSFELRDVVLLDPAGREALRLPRLLAALTPSSLWGMGFEQIFIDQADLEIRRAADGKIYVGGLDMSQTHSHSHSNSNAAADWFFSQKEFSIKGGTIRWIDELRGAPPLALTQVDAVIRNTRRRHAMRLDATPPTEWGDRFSLRGLFREPLLPGGAGLWADWSGQLYAEFGRVDVSRMNQYVSLDSLGMAVSAGRGSLRAWADVSRGQINGGTADVALAGVNVQLGKALKPLALASMAGRFGGRQLDTGFEFNTADLSFDTPEGLRWPGGNLSVVHSDAMGSAPQRTEFKADRLDLAALAQIAARLPLSTHLRAQIESYAPKGLVEAIDARWEGPSIEPVNFSAKGRVSGLELAALPSQGAMIGSVANQNLRAAPGRPGINGATVEFDVTNTGGKAAVKIVNGALDLPGIFEDPRVPMNQLSMDTQWKRADGKIDAQLRNIRFSNVDTEGVAQASWSSAHPAVTPAAVQGKPATGPRLHDGSLGVLDLQGTLSRGDGARVHRYLPVVLPERVRHYVRDAVQRGDLSDVKFKVKGAVDSIPFGGSAPGDFKISARVKNGTFAFAPKSVQPAGAAPWPALSELDGELLFNRASIEVNGATGKVQGLSGLQLVKVDARIPDLLQSATVNVVAAMKGPVNEVLGFVNTSPIGALTGQVLEKAVATGAADFALRLSLPLNNIDKTRVQGTVTLPGNDVQITPASPLLARAKGVVTFSETGFNVAAAQARFLGGDIRFEGGMRAAARTTTPGSEMDASVVFRAQGNVTAEGMRQAKEFGLASRLAQNATGSAAYTATLGFRRGVAEIAVASNFQGMALSLPAPLGKSADALLPVRFEDSLVRDSMAAGQKLQDQLSLSIGNLASLVYVRDISGAEARVLRGSIGVGLEAGESAPVPDSGVAANINLASVDIDAWEKILSASAGSTGNSAAAPPAATPGRAGVSGGVIGGVSGGIDAVAMSYLPTRMAIRARQLQVEGRKLNRVVVGATREGLNWRANIDADELNGYLEFRQSSGGVAGLGAGRVFARLSRLNLGPNTATEVENILDQQPVNIPALDIVVDDLELRGRKLGRVEIEAVNRGSFAALREGGVREWRLNKFNVILPEAVLTATGNWAALNQQGPLPVVGAAPERRRTVMNFKLDIADSGELLKRFGMKDVIRRGKGKMEGQVAWAGSPLGPDYPSMSGVFNVNIESGQFLKADPGIAKLLGVLSLQSLPRRLTLDFRDVFSEGFAFDFVRGDVTIAQGLASTNNLQMKGVNAAVLMEGSADIAKETQDIKVVVVPEINAGTASLIATVINPAIGVGTFLAQYFLRRPLIQAATQEFHIDGSWADPKITKVGKTP